MRNALFIIILLLGVATYSSAIIQMYMGQYSPSLFSRGIWLLLGINSFAGVMLGGGSGSTKLLAGILLVGNTALFVVSFKKGSREFGYTETISLVLFAISCILWLTIDAPLINLSLSLVAHFIGGIPTIKRTFKRPESEKALHWYFFLIASILTILNSHPKTIATVLFPVYFVFFDSLIIILVNRRRFT